VTSKQSIVHDRAAHDREQCIHCSSGWVYEPDAEIGEDRAIQCWMCKAGRR
jgi:hypothetical protein